MKKFWPFLLLLISSMVIWSCDRDNKVDNDTISSVLEYPNVNFSYNNDDGWNFYKTFGSLPVSNSDVALIYLKTDTSKNGSPIWTPLPAKFNPVVNNVSQEVYYDFDFTVNDFKVYVRGTYDLSTTPNFLNGQTFRVVLVPGGFANKGVKEDLSKLSYDEVIQRYNINDSNVKIIK